MSDGAAAASPAGDDAILPFQLDGLAVRGRVARLDSVLDRILGDHAYPPSVSALVGEAALITALVGHALKLRGRFSLQARGDGPVRLVATDFFAASEERPTARLRAYAGFDAEATPETSATPAALIGDGVMAMTIDQGPHMRPYQGLTPISEAAAAAGGLAAGAETYFAQSEQLATKFKVSIAASQGAGGALAWRAGGVMLQHLGAMGESAAPPDAPRGVDGLMTAEDVAEMSDSPDDWRQASLLLDTVEDIELIGPHVSPEGLLIRLFHEVGPRVFPPQPLAFGCTCTREAIEAVLRGYAPETLASMTTDRGVVEASCQFCGKVYSVDPAIGEGRRDPDEA